MEVAENLDMTNFEVRTEEDPDVEPYIQKKKMLIGPMYRLMTDLKMQRRIWRKDTETS